MLAVVRVVAAAAEDMSISFNFRIFKGSFLKLCAKEL